MCLISVQAFLAQSLRSGVCFPLKYMHVVQGKLGLSKVHYVSWLNPITLTGDAAQFSQHHWNLPVISFTVTPHPGTHCQSSRNVKWFPLHFPLFSLEPVCVCVCVCMCVCVERERQKEKERERLELRHYEKCGTTFYKISTGILKPHLVVKNVEESVF